MIAEKLLKIGKIGTAVSAFILLLPGNKFAIPAGLYLYICMLDGLNDFIYGLVFFASMTFYIISALNKFNTQYDDICIIGIILISYLLIALNIDIYFKSADTSSFFTLLLFIIFSLATFILTLNHYKKRLQAEKNT
ncbi:hypothetical protein [Parasediminibacterium sp. JCM 36343]|uniref:hypothetical protein n=1 Tax=Parasediminibacterium sp. JCM 36343 TaxID=3374279 RepID=UPI003978FDA7